MIVYILGAQVQEENYGQFAHISHVHKISHVTDIEKAFLMVSMAKEDWDVMRFLWVELWKMYTHPFQGSRPWILVESILKYLPSYAIVNSHTEKYRGSDPIFVDMLLHFIYIDGIVFEAESIESAHVLYRNCKLWFLQSGLTLRKFVTKTLEQIQNNEAYNQTCS